MSLTDDLIALDRKLYGQKPLAPGEIGRRAGEEFGAKIAESLGALYSEKALPGEESHMEDDPEIGGYCNHPSHEPPSHMVIPSGKRYVHVCPGCRRKTIVRNLTAYA